MSNINEVAGVDATSYVDYTRVTAQSGSLQTETNFSSILAGAMKGQMANVSLAAGGGLSGMPIGYLPTQNQGIEQAIVNAASSGGVDDAQVAMLMLCMMMQSNQEGEFSMLMQMMGSMLTQIQADKEVLRGNVMSSGYDPYILDLIDKEVFNTKMPDVSRTGRAVIPVEQWKSTVPALTSNQHFRSPQLYRNVIDQFQVETAERYKPFRNGNTYCNIFVRDVTSAIGAEIPLYTDPMTGDPRYYPDIKGATAMGATAMEQWLSTCGSEYGWHEVDARTAQMHANQGRPAVTSAGSLGHVQIICPSRDGGFDPIRGVAIAQAGRIVTSYTHISSIYGSSALNSKVKYWIHG